MARDVKFLVDDVKKAVATGGQSASVLIMNSLSQKGPRWTGKFSSAWSAVSGRTKKGSPPRQSQGPKFQYKISDVKKAVIPKNVKGIYNLYTILNESPYADQALDLEPFVPTGIIPPEPEKVFRGTRKKFRGFRPIERKGPNRSTADLDWYPDYATGGAFAKDFKAGMRSGLKLVSRNPGNA